MGDRAEEVGQAAAAEEVDNALTENSLTVNSLTVNSLTVNSLTVNSLTVNSLTVNSLVNSALTDPNARAVMKYIVGCALPAGNNLTVEIPVGSGAYYTFSGQVGLYPQWGQGSCPAETCQPWVSACVIARMNAAGNVVPLSIRGAILAADAAEQSLYPTADAVYFGNIFTQPQIRYACMPSGGTITRVCGRDGGGNPVPASSCTAVSLLGACSSFCDTHAADGSWQGCWDTPSPRSSGAAYSAAVSVFLQSGQTVP